MGEAVLPGRAGDKWDRSVLSAQFCYEVMDFVSINFCLPEDNAGEQLIIRLLAICKIPQMMCLITISFKLVCLFSCC